MLGLTVIFILRVVDVKPQGLGISKPLHNTYIVDSFVGFNLP